MLFNRETGRGRGGGCRSEGAEAEVYTNSEYKLTYLIYVYKTKFIIKKKFTKIKIFL